MEPFAVQASRGCSTPCNLALALAAEFVPVRLARADRALDELAARLFGARDGGPVDQLHALARLAGAHLEAVVLSTAIDDLLFNRVAPDGAGHRCCSPSPARRRRAAPACPWASLRAPTAPSLSTASSPSRCSSILRAVPCATRARCTRPCRGSAATRWRHASSTASASAPSASCHLCWALRAAELRLALPFEAPTRDRLEADLRRIRARLN
jgi:hypothetical protein